MSVNHSSLDHSDLEWIARTCGKAKRLGVNKWVCLCPAHDDHTPSLSVSLGHKGQLLFYCHAGCNYNSVIDALRPDAQNLVNIKQGGLEDNSPRYISYPKNNLKLAIKYSDILRSDNSDKNDNIFGNTNDPALKKLITSARPILNSPVESYLTKRLNGGFSSIQGVVTPVIRYLASHWHVESQKSWPAMLAAILKGGEIIGLHRTYLDSDGNKAPASSAKKILGKLSGGYTPFGKLGNVLILAEGIETALSLYAMFQTPVWAALSATNMTNLILPPLPLAGVVYIAQDNDGAGRQASQKAAQRFWQEGRRVVLMNPPDHLNDFNDYLMTGEPYEQYRHHFY